MARFNSHKLIDGLAFTDDGILIHNVMANCLPPFAKEDTIKRHFEQFGKVVGTCMIGSEYCRVHFENPRDATRALAADHHVIMGRRISVISASSSAQPEGLKLLKFLDAKLKANHSTTNSKQAVQDVQKSSVFRLNDDCLGIIFKCLDLSDQLNFALTCQQFYNTATTIWKVQYSHLNVYDLNNLTLLQKTNFLQIQGAQIKILDICYLDTEDEAILLGKYCLNVEKLYLLSYKKGCLLQKLVKDMTLIQEFILNGKKLSDSFTKFLRRFKDLKRIRMLHSERLTGKYMNRIPGLEKLEFIGRQQSSPIHFKSLCNNIKYIKELDVRAIYLAKQEDYEHICKNLLNLELLRITVHGENYNCIAQLPKLRNLEIVKYKRNTNDPEDFFATLAEYKANHLEALTVQICELSLQEISSIGKLKNLKYLNYHQHNLKDEMLHEFSNLTELRKIILGNCSSISNAAILNLLTKCLKLIDMDLHRCNSLTPAFVPNATEILQKHCNRLRLNVTFGNNFRTKLHGLKAVNFHSDILQITGSKHRGSSRAEEEVQPQQVLQEQQRQERLQLQQYLQQAVVILEDRLLQVRLELQQMRQERLQQALLQLEQYRQQQHPQ